MLLFECLNAGRDYQAFSTTGNLESLLVNLMKGLNIGVKK